MVNILFVCLGNICRSPAAEAIMQNIINLHNKSDSIKCSSAGTSAYHIGEQADSRMRKAALERGIKINHKVRKFTKDDFDKFHYIIAMDNANYDDILSLDRKGQYKKKVHRLIEFCPSIEEEISGHKTITEVPDPYYTGEDGFKLVLDILELGCNNLFEKIIKEEYRLLTNE